MDETMESSVSQCSVHQNQLYQFYCRDCKACVCVECLPSLHRKHVFSNLEDAESEIRKEFHNYITDNQEENKKLDEILELLQQKIDDLATEKIEIKKNIENLAENMKLKIDISKKELISSLEAMYEENNVSVVSVRDSVQKWQLKITHVKEENVEEYSFLQVANIVGKLRKCIRCAEDIDTILKRPILERNSTVCNIGMLAYKSDTNDNGGINSKSAELNNVSVHTQTENLDDFELDVEWYDAEDSLESEYGFDNSSDELKVEYPLTIKLDNDKTNISKIVPVSNRDAWIIGNTNLQKIQDLVLEKDIFAKSVDDIAVLDESSLLILIKGSNVILKLLPNKRLVRFVSVSSVPHCLCTTANKYVLIALAENTWSKITNCIVQINQDGIQSSIIKCDVYRSYYPFAMETFNSDNDHIYALCHQNNSTIFGHSTIIKINKRSGVSVKQFDGACGMEPSKDFKCFGIVCDSDNILVSDNIHHKIYALDKDLKFKKCIVDASHGLESPKAIALKDNLLWVNDQSKIYIFNTTNING